MTHSGRLRSYISCREGPDSIVPVRLPLQEAVGRVMDGAITCAPSRVLVMKAARLLYDEANH